MHDNKKNTNVFVPKVSSDTQLTMNESFCLIHIMNYLLTKSLLNSTHWFFLFLIEQMGPIMVPGTFYCDCFLEKLLKFNQKSANNFWLTFIVKFFLDATIIFYARNFDYRNLGAQYQYNMAYQKDNKLRIDYRGVGWFCDYFQPNFMSECRLPILVDHLTV